MNYYFSILLKVITVFSILYFVMTAIVTHSLDFFILPFAFWDHKHDHHIVHLPTGEQPTDKRTVHPSYGNLESGNTFCLINGRWSDFSAP
jgi:hypothetical protein